MRYRFGRTVVFSSADVDAVTLSGGRGFSSTSVMFENVRLSTTIDEQASKVQYMFFVRENFLTNLRNWTKAPETDHKSH